MPFNYPNQPPVDYINEQPPYKRPMSLNSFPDKVDVLIIGAGPAGLMAANALSSFGINIRIIDQRPESIPAGQADGIQPRTIEVFQSYGLANRLLKEGNQMWEHSFWNPGPNGTIERTDRAPDVTAPTARYQFEVTLHQGAIENIFLDAMSMRGLIVDRPTTVHDFRVRSVDESKDGYNVEVTLSHLKAAISTGNAQVHSNIETSNVMINKNENIEQTIILAKYVIGCDGAHSWVRKKLGFVMDGGQTDDVWGVIDSRLQSNFPDMRNRSTIHSNHGTCIVVPREADVVRLYIQLRAVERGNVQERIDRTKMTTEMLMEVARKTFAPYKIEWPDIDWWTIYIIGQRYASHFANDGELIFIAGDACHTHSPKAGQGMNASMGDTHNLAWKLAMVIKGLAHPTILKTYELERRMYAKQLIEFDKKWAKLFSDKPAKNANEAGVTHEEFLEAFQTFGGFTSGIAIQYEVSLITAHARENQALAGGLPIGKSFPSKIVVRHADARPFHFHDHMPTDLRFRILIFAGNCLDSSQLKALDETAAALQILAKRYTPSHFAYDDVLDFITVSSNPHAAYEKESLPFFLHQNRWKIFCDEIAADGSGGSAYASYKIDKNKGALVVIRPDGYVAEIAPVNADGVEQLNDYFKNILIQQN